MSGSSARSEELIACARDLASELRARAPECDARRSLLPATVADFRKAGFLRILQPAPFGGYELGLPTLIDVTRELGRGCGSSAWCLALFALHNRLVGLFDERAQREVFGDGGDALLAAVFAASGAATPAGKGPGVGYRVTGRWRFASGCDHADWLAVTARVAHRSDRPIPDVRCFLVPGGQFRIEDTWFVAGLRGTGSKDVIVEDVFVPAYRALSFFDVARGVPPGSAVNASPLFRLPLSPVLALAAGGPALGLAQAAIQAFRSRAGAGASGTRDAPARQSATDQRSLAEAVVVVDAAAQLLHRDVEDLTRALAAGERVSQGQRARYLLDGAFVVTSCSRAVDRLFTASAADVLFNGSPLQRAFLDLRAMSVHSTLRLDAATEMFGRIELGLPVASSRLLI